MTLPIKYIANNFLQYDFTNGSASTTPMKIQKLVYLVHGWYLAVHGEPLIDESFEVWPYGPVQEDLYHLFKGYRNTPITSYAKSWVGDQEKAFVVSDTNTNFYDVFNEVIQKYMNFSALQLSALTHQDGTPWSITKEMCEGTISNDLIRDHFRGLVNG